MKKTNKNAKLKTFLIIFLITLSIFIIKYRGFGLGDINEYMVLVQHSNNPVNFKNDWFVNSVADFNIRENFSNLINFFNSFIGNYEITIILLLFISALLFSIGFYKVMFLLTKNYHLSLFSVIFATGITRPAIGGRPFEIGEIFVSSTVALIFTVWVLYFYLKDNYFLSFLLLGIASLIHISHVYLVYGILMFALILKKTDPRRSFWSKEELKKKIINISKSLSFFIFFSLAIIPLALGYAKSIASISSKEIIYLFKFRAPWHYDIFSWDILVWVLFILVFTIFIIAFRDSKIEEKYKRTFKILIIGIFIYFLIETIFTSFILIGSVIKIHFFRINEFLDILMSFFIIDFAYNKISKGKSYFRDLWKEKKRKKYTPLIFILIVLLIIINALFYLILTSERFAQFLFVTRGPLLILTVFLAMILLIDSAKIKKFLMVLLTIGLIAYLVYNPLINRYEYDKETSNMYDFIKDNTPEEAIFLIPPNIATFRLGTDRAIVVDLKAFPFSEKSMLEWYERILDTTNSQDKKYKKGISIKENILPNYNSLTEQNILFLKEKYGFSYVVFEGDKNLTFEKVFENEKYMVYEI